MARFLTSFQGWLNDDEETWTLTAPLVYQTDIELSIGNIITVPTGFVTDLATVPRWPFTYWIAGGKAKRPAVIHDWMYVEAIDDKAKADLVFHEAMGVIRMTALLRRYMYLATVIGGQGNYARKIRQTDETMGG